MSEEYEIIFITEEGRAIKNNKTGKIYHSEFEIIDEKNKEIDRLNNIINELENTIENFMENHTEGYLDWKYDREIYLAESNVLQKLCDTYFDKLKELKENK